MISLICLVILSGLLCSGIVTGLEVRLAGNGATYSSGRVEIRRSSSEAWGTVCDDYWGDRRDPDHGKRNADVVCRMLGFLSAERAAVGGAGFGQGTGTVYLDDIKCRGSESDLMDCPSKAWGSEDCDHNEDVGVVCRGPNIRIREVRLAGGTHRSGRIEVQTGTRNVWETLCDSYWERSNADVVCRILGLRFSKAIRNGGSAVSLGFGPGSGDIFPFSFKCNGFEPHLNNCSRSSLESQNHTHNEDLGVECSGLEVRLANGTDRSGRVEIRRNKNEGWGTVCNDLWTVRYYGKQNADVVCRMLGFTSGEPIVMTSQFGQGVGAIIMNNVKCNGTESDLLDCPSILGAGVGVHTCDHSEDVGVVCQVEAETTTSQPLTNQTQQTTMRTTNITQLEAFTCPENLAALTSPGTGLATFKLKIGQLDHIFRLPMGPHSYIIKSSDKTCNITLLAADYRVRNTLEFVADYTVDCSVVNSTVTWKLLEDVANQKYSIIEGLCDSVCKKPGHDARPVLSCSGKNDLQIRWPTDLVFTADAVSVPANITQTLESRIKTKGLTLDVVVFGASPPIVFPNQADNGGYARISLSTTCISGLTYSDVEKKCV